MKVEEFGDFWIRKMKTFHDRIDADRDGLLTEKDFILMAERFSKVGNLDEKGAQEIKEYFINEIWIKYFKSSTGGDSSTADDLIENLKRHGKKSILATTYDIHSRYFNAIDTNKDGVIRMSEFSVYSSILGYDSQYTKEAFDSLDVDHDGVISRDEFISGGNDFFNEEIEGSPGAHFFGPLI